MISKTTSIELDELDELTGALLFWSLLLLERAAVGLFLCGCRLSVCLLLLHVCLHCFVRSLALVVGVCSNLLSVSLLLLCLLHVSAVVSVVVVGVFFICCCVLFMLFLACLLLSLCWLLLLCLFRCYYCGVVSFSMIFFGGITSPLSQIHYELCRVYFRRMGLAISLISDVKEKVPCNPLSIFWLALFFTFFNIFRFLEGVVPQMC